MLTQQAGQVILKLHRTLLQKEPDRSHLRNHWLQRFSESLDFLAKNTTKHDFWMFPVLRRFGVLLWFFLPKLCNFQFSCKIKQNLDFPWPLPILLETFEEIWMFLKIWIGMGADKPGLPRLVMTVRFGYFRPFRPENPETDWDDKPGLPKLVIPLRFGVFCVFSARKP